MQEKLVSMCLAAVVASFVGCSGTPARISTPRVDASDAANQAIELYDADGDSALDKEELAACPAVLAMMGLYDRDSDGRVSHDELANRLDQLYGQKVGLTQLSVQVDYRGTSLADAQVVLEPEPYLGAAIEPAQGTTNERGIAMMTIPADALPDSLRNRKFLQCGTYKVRITHPQIDLPAKYNTETTLGYETQLGNPSVTFDLR